MGQTTQNSMVIKATQEDIYNAFINPAALEIWQAPGDMTAKVHKFDHRVSGGYEMSLYYPENETKVKGKTTDKEDRFTARFVELIPNQKIVEAIKFDTTNPYFAEEMIMEVTFNPVNDGTEVTYLFKNIPKGIKPEENEEGTKSSLKHLAKYVEGNSTRKD